MAKSSPIPRLQGLGSESGGAPLSRQPLSPPLMLAESPDGPGAQVSIRTPALTRLASQENSLTHHAQEH